jgi:drug/metabolite transporter (DMT)-like permease
MGELQSGTFNYVPKWLFGKPFCIDRLAARMDIEIMPEKERAARSCEPTSRPGKAAKDELLALGQVMLAMIFAGSSIVVGKIVAVRLPVFLAVELSLLAALAVLLPLQLARRLELRLLDRRQLKYMFLQALFGIVLFRVFTLYGLRFTSAVHAGIITSASPAVMALLAAIFLKERLPAWRSRGIVLVIAGLCAINLYGLGASTDRGFLVGNLLVGAAVACEALLTIFRKSAGARISSITNATVLVAFSLLMLLPLALFDLKGFRLTQIQPLSWLALLYYGAIATVVAYILWGSGALRIPANQTGLAAAVMPLSALVLSALVLGESLVWIHIAGCAAVVAGIVCGSRPAS